MSMAPIFYDQGYYNKKVHGSLEDYVRAQEQGNGVTRLFRGLKQFRMLWDEGFIMPGLTNLRLMYNLGRGDEHYRIINERHLDGMSAGAHSGRPGKFTVEEILSPRAPPFEVQPLRRKNDLITRRQEAKWEMIAAALLMPLVDESLTKKLTTEHLVTCLSKYHPGRGVMHASFSLNKCYAAVLFETAYDFAKDKYARMRKEPAVTVIAGFNEEKQLQVIDSGKKGSVAYIRAMTK